MRGCWEDLIFVECELPQNTLVSLFFQFLCC